MAILDSVAGSIGVPVGSCRRIAAAAHRRYKQFYIPKRQLGELRLVAQPSKDVKAVQRGIVAVLENLLPVHPAATAYQRGASILENARRHANSRFITKLDFSQFFPSIDAPAVAHCLRSQITDIDDRDVEFILDACLWFLNGVRCLCIGAPSSPFISNAVMYEFDQQVFAVANGMGFTYTRYSDDVTISSIAPNVLADAEIAIREICARYRHPQLRINENKRVAVDRSTRRQITGLTISNDGRVTVGRIRKRGVRAGVSKFIRAQLSADEVVVLRGELAFVLNIEPEFRAVLERTYGDAITQILPRQR